MVGSDADLASVLTRLLRADRLDVEVGHAPSWRTAGGPGPEQHARVPLIRDETGDSDRRRARSGPALPLRGEAVVDDTVLFDGDVPGVRIEPTATMPGLRAARHRPGPAALGHRPRRAARHPGSDGGPRRCCGTATGEAVDVLSAHRGLAAGRLIVRRDCTHGRGPCAFTALSAFSTCEHPPAAPIGAAQPDLPGDRRAHGGRRGAGLDLRRHRPATGLRRGVHLRRRRLAGVAVPARVRARLHRVAVRRPRRRGARLSDAQPVEVLASRCCRSGCRCCSSRSGGIGLPGGAVYVRTSWMTQGGRRPGQLLPAPRPTSSFAVLLLALTAAIAPTPTISVFWAGHGVPRLPAGDRLRAEHAADPGAGRLRRAGAASEPRRRSAPWHPSSSWGFFILLLLLFTPGLNQWFWDIVLWFFDLLRRAPLGWSANGSALTRFWSAWF